MAAAKVKYQEEPLHVVLKKSRRARRFSLKLNHRDRQVDLISPYYASERKAYLFAEQNRDWILDKLNSLPHAVPFTHGSRLPLFGETYQLQIDFDPNVKNTSFYLSDGRLTVKTNKPDPSARVERYLKQMARTHLLNICNEKARQIGKKLLRLTIRDTSTRWGSCSSDGNIALSWRLIFAPPEVADYVVAHEIAHLKHLDHGDSFWKLCAAISHNYEAGKSWIRQNGHTLLRYGTAARA